MSPARHPDGAMSTPAPTTTWTSSSEPRRAVTTSARKRSDVRAGKARSPRLKAAPVAPLPPLSSALEAPPAPQSGFLSVLGTRAPAPYGGRARPAGCQRRSPPSQGLGLNDFRLAQASIRVPSALKCWLDESSPGQHRREELRGDLAVEQTVAHLREGRMVPGRPVRREPDEPAEQEVELEPLPSAGAPSGSSTCAAAPACATGCRSCAPPGTPA